MFLSGWTDKDGNSLVYEPLGVWPSPDGKHWSSRPYTKEQKKVDKQYRREMFIRDKVIEHLERTNRSILDEVYLIQTKKSTLPRYCRDWLTKQLN